MLRVKGHTNTHTLLARKKKKNHFVNQPSSASLLLLGKEKQDKWFISQRAKQLQGLSLINYITVSRARSKEQEVRFFWSETTGQQLY